jgi:hypothetical protein
VFPPGWYFQDLNGSRTDGACRSRPSSKRRMNTVSKPEDERNLAFVTRMGPPIKDAASRKLVKHFVMQQVGRSRRKPGLNRRQIPLQYSLQIPNTFLPTDHDRSPSLWTSSYYLEKQQSFNDDEQQKRYGFPPEVSQAPQDRASASNKEGQSRESFQQDLCSFSASVFPWVDDYDSKAEFQVPIGVLDRLGAGRFDPFARFPIELNHRARELVDTS